MYVLKSNHSRWTGIPVSVASAYMPITSTDSLAVVFIIYLLIVQYYLLPPPLNLYFFSVDFCSCYYKICNMLYECSKVLSLEFRHVDYMCAIENLRKGSVYTN